MWIEPPRPPVEQRDDALRRLTRGLDLLLESNLEFDTPAKKKPSFELTPRDLDVLDCLAELRYLTTTMIGILVWGSFQRRVQQRMTTLHDARLVRRFRPMVSARRNSVEWVYELTQRGYRALVDARPDVTTPGFTQSEIVHFSYAEHDLEVNHLLIALMAWATHWPGGLVKWAPFAYGGPLTGRLDLRDLQPAKRPHPQAAADRGESFHPGSSVEGVILPDLTIYGGQRNINPQAVLIEYDRTRRPTKLVEKLQRYDRLVSESWRRSWLATCPLPPLVLFVVREESRMQGVLDVADEVLSARTTKRQTGEVHYIGRECIGVTCRQRLLDGNWEFFTCTDRPQDRGGRKHAHVQTDAFDFSREFYAIPGDMEPARPERAPENQGALF